MSEQEARCPLPHEDWANETCPECGQAIDQYGNCEADPIRNCCFPDCGCDGARLCMAGEANDFASRANVEGMWRRKGSERITPEDKRTFGQARMELLAGIYKEPTE